jgi:RNA polymerase sigma-70 factor (ECF subfamily)
MDEDADLMLCAGKGDVLAFVRLYEKYLPMVVRRLRDAGNCLIPAEDVAQEVFLRLWARRTEFRGSSEFRTYLWGHVRRVLLEEQRHRAKIDALARHSRQDSCRRGHRADTPEDGAARSETSRLLHQAILRLTTDEAEALRLYYDERMLVREAAAFIGCTETCLESRLQRARGKLRGFLRATAHGRRG